MSCTMGAVLAAPPQAAASERHPLTRQYCSAPSFRIVTYNILADQYAATDYAQQVLFSFCPAEYAALCPSMVSRHVLCACAVCCGGGINAPSH